MRTRIIPLLLVLIAGPVAAAPDGAKLYEEYCMVCHGEQGRGGVGVPLALGSLLSSVSDRYLHTTIRAGRPGRVMPAFSQLSDAEVDAIVGYLRGLAKVPVQHFDDAPIRGDAARGATLFAQQIGRAHV